jgi:hypothetical protein
MQGKNFIRVLAASLLICALVVTNGLAQGQPGEKTSVTQAQPGKKMTVEGKIQKATWGGGGYIIRTRAEVLTINNPYPAVLEPLAKSGERVSIEALSMGDRLIIQAINGKKYQDTPKPATK